jgi:hypothetical protein
MGAYLEERRGTRAVGHKGGKLLTECQEAAEQETACKGLLVCQRSSTRHGRALTEAAHSNAVGWHACLHLIGNQAVDEILGGHGALLVLGRVRREADYVGPRWHRHSPVQGHRPSPSIRKHPFDVRQVQLVRNGCPAMPTVAEAVEPDNRARVLGLCLYHDWRFGHLVHSTCPKKSALAGTCRRRSQHKARAQYQEMERGRCSSTRWVAPVSLMEARLAEPSIRPSCD